MRDINYIIIICSGFVGCFIGWLMAYIKYGRK